MEKLITAVQEARASFGSDSQEFKDALCDFGIEIARAAKIAKLARASHKTGYAIRYQELRETIKTDAERCRVIDYDLRNEIEDVKRQEAEVEELNAIYRAFRIVLPKNEFVTDMV